MRMEISNVQVDSLQIKQQSNKINVSKTDNGQVQVAVQGRAPDEEEEENYASILCKWNENVDKGYAWVVLIALFVCMCSLLGTYRIYGLIFSKVTQEGIYDRTDASLPVTMIYTTQNLFGPFCSIIVTYYISFKQTVFIGGALITIGNLVAYSNYKLESKLVDIIFLGCVQGVGYAFVMMPLMQIINSYFVRYRNLALGIVLSGGTLSVFAWSPLIQHVLDNYSWRAAYFVVGSICSLIMLMAPLIRSNPRPVPPLRNNELIINSEQKVNHHRPEAPATSDLQANDSMLNWKFLNWLKEHINVFLIYVFFITFWKPSSSGTAEREPSSSVLANDAKAKFNPTIVRELLKKPVFHIIWLNELIFFWIFTIYSLILPDLGRDRGCDKVEADALLIFQSIGELVGRLGLAFLVDKLSITNRNVAILLLFSNCLFLLAVTQISGLFWLAITTIGVTGTNALLYININGLIIDHLGERQLTMAYGLASFISGIFLFLRPYAVGLFRDHLNSYDGLLISMAAFCAVAGFLWLIGPTLCNLESRNRN